MTISTAVSQKVYDGNDSSTIFPYTFKIDSSSHLTVIIADSNDVQYTLVLDTNYTVSYL